MLSQFNSKFVEQAKKLSDQELAQKVKTFQIVLFGMVFMDTALVLALFYVVPQFVYLAVAILPGLLVVYMIYDVYAKEKERRRHA